MLRRRIYRLRASLRHRREERDAARKPAPGSARPVLLRERYSHLTRKLRPSAISSAMQRHADARDLAAKPVDPNEPKRPLVREQYWRFRHRLWEQRQAFASRSIPVRLLAGALTLAVAAGLGVAATAIAKTQVSPPAKSVAELLKNPYYLPRIESPKAPKRVLVAGDTNAWLLSRGSERYTEPGIIGLVHGLELCDMAGRQLAPNARQVKAEKACKNWPLEFSTAADMIFPRVSVLMLGSSEAYDHVFRSKWLATGSTAYADHLKERLATAQAALTDAGELFILTTVPCSRNPDGTVNRYVTWLNAVILSYAAEHRQTVTVGDLDGFLCRGGPSAKNAQGLPLVSYGAMTTDGAKATWHWIAAIAKREIAANPRR